MHIAACRAALDARYDMAVELRSRAWLDGAHARETFAMLTAADIAFVVVDELASELYRCVCVCVGSIDATLLRNATEQYTRCKEQVTAAIDDCCPADYHGHCPGCARCILNVATDGMGSEIRVRVCVFNHRHSLCRRWEES